MKNIVLTPRDQHLFQTIYDLVFVDIDFLRNVIFRKKNGDLPKRQYVQKRMRDLEAHGFISSHRLPITDRHIPMGRTKKVYTLDSKGIEEVRACLGEHVKWDKRWTDRTPSHINHALEMTKVYAAFETAQNPDLKLYDWLNETRAQHRFSEGTDGQIKPDSFLIFDGGDGRYGGIIVELERSKQRQIVSVKKLERYNQYCYDKAFQKHEEIEVKIGPPRIIFVSLKENEMNNLIKHTENVDTSDTFGVLYTTLDELIANPYGRIFKAKNSMEPDQLYSLFDDLSLKG